MKWILEKWEGVPVRLRIFGLCVFGLFVLLQAWSVVTTGQLLDFKFLDFLGI